MSQTQITVRGEPSKVWGRTPNEAVALAELAAELAGIRLDAVEITAEAQEIGAGAEITPVKYLTFSGVADEITVGKEETKADLERKGARLRTATGQVKFILDTLAVLHIIDLEELEGGDALELEARMASRHMAPVHGPPKRPAPRDPDPATTFGEAVREHLREAPMNEVQAVLDALEEIHQDTELGPLFALQLRELLYPRG